MSFFIWNKYGEYRSRHTAFLYNLGTLVAAHDAYLAEKQKHNYLTKGRYEEYIVNATNPYFMTDTTGEFSPKAIAADMHKNGVLTRIEYKDIVSREGADISDRDSNAAKYLREKIQAKGYDSIIYMNANADPGSMGVIVLDPSQLTLVSIDGKPIDENIALEKTEESGYNENILTIKTGRNSGEKAEPYSYTVIPEYINDILLKLKNYGDVVSVEETPSFSEISLMSRQSGTEYASITIGHEHYIIKGDTRGTPISNEMFEKIKNHRGTLNCHSHPFIDDFRVSKADINIAKQMYWQKEFYIVSPDGKFATYDSNGIISIDIIKKKLDDSDYDFYLELFKED